MLTPQGLQGPQGRQQPTQLLLRAHHGGPRPGALGPKIKNRSPLGEHAAGLAQHRIHSGEPATIAKGIGGEVEHPHQQWPRRDHTAATGTW